MKQFTLVVPELSRQRQEDLYNLKPAWSTESVQKLKKQKQRKKRKESNRQS